MHMTIRGGTMNDANEIVIEDLMDLKNLEDVDVNTSVKSVFDPTLVSSTLGRVTNWEVLKECSIGSDYFPIASSITSASRIRKLNQGNTGNWLCEKANWGEFPEMSNVGWSQLETNKGSDIEIINSRIASVIKNLSSK